MTVRTDIVAALRTVSLLGRTVYADKAPEAQPRPYAVVLDTISEAAALKGDAATKAWRRLVQVDLWEDWDASTDALANEVVNVLDGRKIEAGFHCSVQGTVRTYDREFDLVHTVITVEVVRLPLAVG